MGPPDAPALPAPPVTSFASDNAAGVLSEVMDALAAANEGSALAYGADPWTERATALLAERFGCDVEVAFCWGGTGANVVGLACLLEPWEAVVCADGAHIHADECGAPERFTGAKLLTVPTVDGKLRPGDLERFDDLTGVVHHVQPRVVSITQSTERGTLYQPGEVADLAAAAHERGMHLHVDGARLANAVAALGGGLRAITTDAGVDVVTFGATKAGAMYGEAVVFLRPELGEHVGFVRKQAAQLPSKMRFVAAQFEALLTDDLWLRAAGHANAMARRLAGRLDGAPGVALAGPPEVNSVFVRLPDAAAVAELQAWSFAWDWDTSRHEVRLMTSFATTDDDVDRMAGGVAAVAARHARPA